jgi:hypothetical protein
MRPTSSRLALAALVGAALIAGCGGGDDDADPNDVVERAYSGDTVSGIESGVLSIEAELGESGESAGAQGVGAGKLTIEGPFSEEGADLALSFQGSARGGEAIDFSGELVATSDNAYVGFNDRVYEIGAERFQAFKETTPTGFEGDPEQTFDEGCRLGLQAQGLDPGLCEDLDPRSWIGDFSDEGSEEIEGVETTHYSAEINAEELIADFVELGFAAIPESQRQGIPDAESITTIASNFIERAKIDAFVDGEDQPLRTGLDLGLAIPGAALDLRISATLSELNEPQTIAAPTNAQPLESLRGDVPTEVRPLFDCFLEARSPEELNECSASAAPAASSAPGLLPR